MRSNMPYLIKTLIITMLLFVCLMTGAVSAAEKNVGVLWIGESGMATRVSKGLVVRLKEQAPDIHLEFKMELESEAKAVPIYEAWQESKDAIVFLRSTGAEYMGKHPPKIPGFIGGCSNPVVLGAVQNMEAPEGNITGVTYYINARKKIELFKQLLPNMKSLGLIVEKGHPSAPIDQEETKSACEALGIEYHDAVCASENEVLKSAKTFSQSADLIILGSQAMINAQARRVAGIVGNTPIAAYIYSSIQGIGSLCGLAANDEKLGGMLADSVISVVKEGKAINDVPVKVDPEPKFLLNMTMVEKLGLIVPEEIQEKAQLVE